jgi:hypothetical protein
MVLASGGDAALEQRLAGAFVAAPGPIRDGLRAALELRAAPRLRAALTAAGPSARPAVAAAIWAVAAAHGERAAPEGRARWIEDPDAEVRRLAWRAEARFAGGAGAGAARGPAVALPRDAYLAAFADPDPGVRRAALEAAARGGQPWLLDELRRATASPSPDAVEQHLMLAILGGPADLAPILSVGRSPALGWSRFTILAACGRAQAVAELLRVMRQGPPVEAALAAAAFFRVTGLDVRLPERIPLVPEGTEAGELDEEIKTCDAALAEEVWRKIEPRMGGSRWAGGADADALAPGDAPLTLDLEARRALHLRAAFARPAARLAADVERFPFT